MSFTLHRITRWLPTPALALATAANAQCAVPMATLLVERFMSADCEACWASGRIAADAPFVLDWIVPSLRGDEAPLSAAAIAEAAERAGMLPAEGSVQRRQALPPQPGLHINIQDGPAWNGYMALRLRVHSEGAALPAGSVGYLALVEKVPAGEDDTPVERRLVRAVAGPLPLDDMQQSTEHLLALRVPPGAKAERLAAVGWVQAASGRMIALADANPVHCAPAK